MSIEPARVSEIRSLLANGPYGASALSGSSGPHAVNNAPTSSAYVPDYAAAGAAGDVTGGSDGVSGGPGGVWGPAGTTLTKNGSVYGLGKDDFLKLFLAQLQNQDPTKPVDDSQFLGQLANLTMVDTLQQVQKSLEGSQLANASGMIGKHVTGLDVDGKDVDGVVEAVVQSNDAGLVLKVGEQFIQPQNVVTVVATAPA